MAGRAERHQIIRVMRAAVSNLLDVVHECRANISALLLAPLAERVPCQVSVTNPAPRTAISFVLIVPACEAVIVPLHRLLMNVTIAAFSVCEIRTARHAAWSFRLPRHLHRLPSYRFHRIQKGHRRSCALRESAAASSLFSAYTIAHVVCEIL